MRSALHSVVRIATGGSSDDVERFPWASLRFQHVAALRSALVDSGAAPATANVRLAAVRGVLRAARPRCSTCRTKGPHDRTGR